MRIACPSCDATYDVPDQMLGSGRKLRCSKCGHQWIPAPTVAAAASAAPRPAPAGAAPPPAPAPAASASAPPLPEPEVRPVRRERIADLPRAPANPPPLAIDRITDANFAPAETMAPVPERGRRTAVWLGWLVSIVVWGLVIWAGYHYRAAIMAAWPPSQRLYAALGIGPGS